MTSDEDLITRLLSRIEEVIAAKIAFEQSKLLTPEDVSKILQVDISWVYRHKKDLGALKLPGTVVRFKSDFIAEFASKRSKSIKAEIKKAITDNDLWR